MHILSAEQFDRQQLDKIFGRADYFRRQVASPKLSRKLANRYTGRQLCSVFFQPSTRTRLSFETAAVKLGMGLVSTENARENSSAAKDESLEDTIKVLNQYGYDAIVMRHHEVGAATRAAAVSKIPIINAGDGMGEHPTQALLDACTIKQHHGRLDNLRVVMGGDLLHGRTIRSLSQMLSKYKNNRLTFVSIPSLQIGGDIKNALKKSGTKFDETSDIQAALKGSDVVYWTRLQKEYLDKPKTLKGSGFRLDLAALKALPKKAIIMHPLPRVDEIDPAIDSDPRAKYFQQAGNGLYVRMALLEQILGKPVYG